MNSTRTARIGITVLVTGALVAGAAGVTRAANAAPSTKGFSACANGKGTLRLVDGKGRCAKGYQKVTLGKQGLRGAIGPRGAVGARGPQGQRGATGARGAAAQTLAVTATAAGTSSVKTTELIGGTGLRISLVCVAGQEAAIYIEDTTGASDWTVGGSTSYASAGGTANYIVTDGAGGVLTPAIEVGTKPANFVVPKSKTANFEMINRSGMLAADILVARGGHTFTVDLSTQLAGSGCGAQAQILSGS